MRRGRMLLRCAALLTLLCSTSLTSTAWSQEQLTDRQRAELTLSMKTALDRCNQTLATCRMSTREVVREVVREVPAQCPGPEPSSPSASPWRTSLIWGAGGAAAGSTATLLLLLLLAR